MPGHSSLYLDQRMLDNIHGVNPYTPSPNSWIALTTIVLTKTDIVMPAGVELNGLGYDRAIIPNDTTFWSPAAIDVSTGLMTSISLVDVAFPDATDDWPNVPGWVEMDAPIGGNVLKSGAFDDQVGLVASGDTPLILAGSLRVVMG